MRIHRKQKLAFAKWCRCTRSSSTSALSSAPAPGLAVRSSASSRTPPTGLRPAHARMNHAIGWSAESSFVRHRVGKRTMRTEARLAAGCATLGMLIWIAIYLPGALDIHQIRLAHRTISGIEYLGAELHRYQKQRGEYPTAASTAQLLEILRITNHPELQRDAWGHALRYELRGCTNTCSGFVIVSPGRDGNYEQRDFNSYQPLVTTPASGGRDFVYGERGWIQYPEGLLDQGAEIERPAQKTMNRSGSTTRARR